MSNTEYFVRVLLLLILCCLDCFGVKSDTEALFQKCCAIGTSKSADNLKCDGKIRTPIAGIAIEHQSICLSTIDLCCMQSLRNIACSGGKQAAKQNKNCNVQPKSDDDMNYKHCCEACKLGLISATTTMQCKLKNFHFGDPWDDAYETCCSEFSSSGLPAVVTETSNEPSDLCQLLPGELCSHICVPIAGSYKCQCNPGYALMADGKSCRPDIVENRCEKYNICDQTCFDNGETLECSCNAGYELLADNKTCVDINECNLKLDNCYASGTACVNTVGSYKCVGDPTTRFGDHINTAATTTPTTTPRSSTVVCVQGYKYDVTKKTCVDIDECREQNSCNKNTDTCVNSPGSYRCVPTSTSTQPVLTTTPRCRIGFVYDSRLNDCLDIDECQDQNSCNRNTETCVNNPGSYRCVPMPSSPKPPLVSNSRCGAGFVYNPQLMGCLDIDECERNPCESNEVCQNRIGSFECDCKSGFQRDPMTRACVDVNECQLHSHNCPETSRCDNTVGSYQCIRPAGCGTGYTLNLETNICEDDNECALGIDNCKLLGPGWECRNIVGSFRCEKKRCDGSNQNCGKTTPIQYCIKGYEMINGECVDIDECQRKNSCQSGETCVNIAGGYKCVTRTTSCDSGLRYNNEQTYCVDIDECTEQPSICDHNCINVWSSFFCACNPGFRLRSDNRSCIDINECEVYKDRRLCIGHCVNTPGSYKCQCPDGYRLGKSGYTCEDIDECSNGTTCNHPEDLCVNTKGSFRCNKITCPPNYVHDPAQKNRCVRPKDFCLLNTNCTQWPMNYLFAFFTLTSNFPIPTVGQMEFYRMRGPSSPSTSSQFSFDLKNVQAGEGANKTTKDYFRLIHHSSNEVTVALVRPIQGPQDIELDLKMQYTYNGAYVGYSISKIFMYISQYDF